MEQTLKQKIDPALTVENLSQLGTRSLNREATANSARILTGGCWNRVIAVAFEGDEQELVFKISPEPRNEAIAREYKVLKYFAENTDMPVPEPLLFDLSGDVIPGTVLVMRKIPGQVLHHAYGLLDNAARISISEQIGHFVGRLHRHKSVRFGGVELDEKQRLQDWGKIWLPRFDTVYADIAKQDLLSAKFLAEIEKARQEFPAHIAIGEQSTLTHYDIWSGNVMVDTNGTAATVSGFIDIPGFWADYARELSFMEVFGSADSTFYAVYKSYQTLDAGFDLRKKIYQLRTFLKHITMYPDQHFYRKGAEGCIDYIRRAG